MSKDDESNEDPERVSQLLAGAGFGPTLETANLLLFMAAELYVREGHRHCAPSVLETHLEGWANAPKWKPTLVAAGREDDKG